MTDDKREIIDKLSEKKGETDILNGVIEKQMAIKNNLEKQITDLEATNLMLENNIETRDIRIYSLEEENRNMEENTTISFVCEKCVKDANHKKGSKDHISLSHSDENLPSTSKCGECDYKSDDENDLQEHRETLHESNKDKFICTHCEFKCDTENELSKHIQLKHELYECKLCDIHFKTEGKLKSHMCKVPIKNPAHGSLYTKGWYDANDCTPVYSSLKNTEVAWLHHKQCQEDNPCAASEDINAEDDDKIEGLEHLKIDFFLENGEINWNRLIIDCGMKQTKVEV